MTSANRVWLARPAQQASALAASLSARGLVPIVAPVLEIKPLVEGDPILAEADQNLAGLNEFDHLVFVSANAAEIGLRRMDKLKRAVPTSLAVYAVGPSTAASLQKLHRPVVVPAGDFTSEGLLAVDQLQDIADSRVLIVRGVGGRSLLARELEHRGAVVHLAELYRRSPPAQLPDQLEQALNAESVCATVVASGETLQNLVNLATSWLPQLRALPMVVPGDRVGKLAQQHGFEQVCIARSAVTEDMLEALASVKAGLHD